MFSLEIRLRFTSKLVFFKSMATLYRNYIFVQYNMCIICSTRARDWFVNVVCARRAIVSIDARVWRHLENMMIIDRPPLRLPDLFFMRRPLSGLLDGHMAAKRCEHVIDENEGESRHVDAGWHDPRAVAEPAHEVLRAAGKEEKSLARAFSNKLADVLFGTVVQSTVCRCLMCHADVGTMWILRISDKSMWLLLHWALVGR